jgi:hypothetical protein
MHLTVAVYATGNSFETLKDSVSATSDSVLHPLGWREHGTEEAGHDGQPGLSWIFAFEADEHVHLHAYE